MAASLFNYANKYGVYPYVVSVSYGWPELYTCQSSITHAHCNGSDAQAYVMRANTELQKTGMLRMSIMIASQDEGAPSEANIDCQLDVTSHPLFAIYPCSSPYVTCVSATTIGPEPTREDPTQSPFPPICDKYPCALSNHEEPCMTNNTYYDWTTGGGFSEFATRPSYQSSVVESYLKSGAFLPPANKFNNSMNRGYPDVSAVGARILIVMEQTVTVEAGTSAATPIFSGVVALLNEYRLNNNKNPLGFLNPMLYQMSASHPSTFQDIVYGTNQCTEGNCCKYGYGCVKGWDSVTGLGTPNYLQMLSYVKTLP